jgi:hypothetical protein
MVDAVHRIDDLIIHIGPHKTGTTSIQQLLQENTELLRTHGVSYAESPVKTGAHHHIPYAVFGWNLALLPWTHPRMSYAPTSLDLQSEVEGWLTAAVRHSCHTVVISAEDFSGFTIENWSAFAQLLSAAEAKTGIAVAQVTICLTERDINERAASQYGQFLKGGLARSAEEFNELLMERLLARDAAVSDIPAAFATPVRLLRVDYRSPRSSASFLQHWVSTVLGVAVFSAIPAKSFQTKLNRRMTRRAQESLREFNRVNTPESAGDFSPFLPYQPEDVERNRAFQRLEMMRAVLADLEHAQSKVNRLEATLLWRLAKRLGVVKAVLRKR